MVFQCWQSWKFIGGNVHKTDEFAHTANGGGLLPITNIDNLLVVHLESILTNVNPQEFMLFQVAIESGILQALEHG